MRMQSKLPGPNPSERMKVRRLLAFRSNQLQDTRQGQDG